MSIFEAKQPAEYTLVPNSFIRTHMADAPEGYVKAYLYGLLCLTEKSGEDIHAVCAALKITLNELVMAFEYWQQKGLVQIKNGKNTTFQYIFSQSDSGKDLYAEQEYNIALQKLFGERVLTPAEYNILYDFTDIFRLPKDVVLVLLEYCIEKKGKNVSFAYIEKIAKSWAEEGVDTVAQAEIKKQRFEAGTSEAGQVLRQLGILDRLPTADEIALYKKWSMDWGFTLDAVKAACTATTVSRSPSMKYLDSIIKGFYEKGMTTSKAIFTALKCKEDESAEIKKVLLALGMSSHTVSPGDIAFFRKWTAVFSLDIILYAAQQASKYSRKSLANVEKILSSWQAAGYRSLSEIEKHLKQNAALNKKLARVFKLSGIQKNVAESDRQKYLKWTVEWGFPEAVIDLACEVSSVTQNPYKYLDKLLSIWKEKGISTLPQAKQELKNTAVKPADRKNNAESLKYMQRNYSEDELNSIFVDLSREAEE